MTISILPQEIQRVILDFLGLPDVLRVAQVSHAFRILVDGHERLWKGCVQNIDLFSLQLPLKQSVMNQIQLRHSLNKTFNDFFKEKSFSLSMKTLLNTKYPQISWKDHDWALKQLSRTLFLRQLATVPNQSFLIQLISTINPEIASVLPKITSCGVLTLGANK